MSRQRRRAAAPTDAVDSESGGGSGTGGSGTGDNLCLVATAIIILGVFVVRWRGDGATRTERRLSEHQVEQLEALRRPQPSSSSWRPVGAEHGAVLDTEICDIPRVPASEMWVVFGQVPAATAAYGRYSL